MVVELLQKYYFIYKFLYNQNFCIWKYLKYKVLEYQCWLALALNHHIGIDASRSALCFGASLIPFAESDPITYDSDVMEADNVDDNDEEEEDDTGHANLRGGLETRSLSFSL